MFRSDFREDVDYFDVNDFTPLKVLLTLFFSGSVTIWNAIQLSEWLYVSESGPHDGQIIISILVGSVSCFFTFIAINFLVNACLGSLEYLRSFALPKEKSAFVSFRLEVLFDVTFKNPIFYALSFSIGHLLGVIERHAYMRTFLEQAPWTGSLGYFATYIQYPVLTFFVGIFVVTIAYLLVVSLQKPVCALLSKWGADDISWMGRYGSLLTRAVKNKSIAVVFFGLIPAFLVVAYITGIGTPAFTALDYAHLYGYIVGIGYSLSVLTLSLIHLRATKHSLVQDETRNRTIFDKDVAKAKQSVVESISPIQITEYVDQDAAAIIKDINAIMEDINPYLALADIEEAHTLKRITEQEIVTLIKHYNKLPVDTKAMVKEELLTRLTSAKQVAAAIAQIATQHHYEEFKKQSHVMNLRYEEKENA